MIPKKKSVFKNNSNMRKRISKERKRMFGRQKMLKRNKRKTVKEDQREKLDKEIQDVENEILIHIKTEKLKEEKRVIESMGEKPKLFFAYVKDQSEIREKIGPFKEGETIISDKKQMSDMLVKQYKLQMGENKMAREKEEIEQLLRDIKEGDLIDVEVTEPVIEESIDELNENSSAGSDDVPAIFLKKTKSAIAKPLKIILRKSLDEGKVPDIFKIANVTPIYKGGTKAKPENYRPVSLTSHIIKIFERVLVKNILKHLTVNNLINKNQHGFVPGRSAQTQWLEHYKDIFETIEKGMRMDTVFLDFAKAFDKVDHSILMRKVIGQGIKGKIGRWILEFLSNRKFKVIIDGIESEEEDVLSGVPQGTVMAAILFTIMISDIDEDVRQCIVRCFADDTRINKRIKSKDDIKRMQEDLNTIYKWAENNEMKFNGNKFEQLGYGQSEDIEIEPYKNPDGEDIQIGNVVKDLGVMANSNITFKEHIESIVAASRIKVGILLRTFHTREKELMMILFNTYIRSRLEYCCPIWSPSEKAQGEINEIERIQKSFTSRIRGMEGLDYHQRLKQLKLYSLERRRERYLIILAWQMREGFIENTLDLKFTKNRAWRVWAPVVSWSKNGKNVKHSVRTKLHNSPAIKMARLFNKQPIDLRRMTGVTVKTYKEHLDVWLKRIPDTPKIDNYKCSAETNSIADHVVTQ